MVGRREEMYCKEDLREADGNIMPLMPVLMKGLERILNAGEGFKYRDADS
jgi:hypothetical protein